MVLLRRRRPVAPSVRGGPAAWGVVLADRAASAVRLVGLPVLEGWVALRVARVVLVALVAVRQAVGMAAPAVSVETLVAVRGLRVGGRAAIAPAVTVLVSAGRVPDLAHHDLVVLPRGRRALQAAVSVALSGRGSDSRIARRADLGRVVRGPAPADLAVLVPRGQRLIGLTSPIGPKAAPTVGRLEARRGGRTSCHRLNSGR